MVEAHNNLGLLARDEGQLDEAAVGFRRAIELQPDNAEAHNNLALVLMGQNRLDESAAAFRHSLELDPLSAETHVNYALALLLAGQLAEGWVEHEWRFRRPATPEPPLPRPRWGGESLAGRTILLRAEQGIGDTIHFVRDARLLKQRGAWVVVECQPALARLLVLAGRRSRRCPWRTAGRLRRPPADAEPAGGVADHAGRRSG